MGKSAVRPDNYCDYAEPKYLEEGLDNTITKMKVFGRGYRGGRESVLYMVKTTTEDYYKFRSIVFYDNGPNGVSAWVMGKTLFLGDLILDDGIMDGSFEHINGDRKDFTKKNLVRKIKEM